MTRHEPEAYGDDVREALDGLRRLARETETPSELLPEILARGEQLLPPPPERRARWWRRFAAWPRSPVWMPAMGVACILVGFWAGSWRAPRVMMQSDHPAARSNTPAQRLVSVEMTEDTSGPSPSAPTAWQSKRQAPIGRSADAPGPAASEPVSAASAPVDMPAALVQKKAFFEPYKAELVDVTSGPAPRFTQSPGATPSQEVTLALPTRVYEELQQQAHRRGKLLGDILREAIDAYLQGQSAAGTQGSTR